MDQNDELVELVLSTDDVNVLTSLAKNKSPRVRLSLAYRVEGLLKEDRPDLDRYSLAMLERALSNDSNRMVRAMIALETTSQNIMALLAIDPNVNVVYALVNNKNLTQEIAEFIAINYLNWGDLHDYAPIMIAKAHEEWAGRMLEIARHYKLDSAIKTIEMMDDKKNRSSHHIEKRKEM